MSQFTPSKMLNILPYYEVGPPNGKFWGVF